MRHQCRGIDRKRARRLDSIGQIEGQRGAQSRGVFSNLKGKIDKLP